MLILYISTAILFIISFFANKQKTLKALKIAFTRFRKILPAFLTMLVFISIVIYIFPQELILKYLGVGNKYISTFIASLIGSITIMPGFIAFPLAGILRQQGVPYMVISAFTTTLMLVGIITFPVEKEYFGVKITIIRNVICFIIAIIVAFIMGVVFGEIGI
ncbi:MAG: permease [Candidatus Cloacimonadota bacterium]|nr:permease [Candidatus Cloacimonadota bacterium]